MNDWIPLMNRCMRVGRSGRPPSKANAARFNRISVALTASESSLKISFAASSNVSVFRRRISSTAPNRSIFWSSSPARSRIARSAMLSGIGWPIPDRNRLIRIIDVFESSPVPTAATMSFAERIRDPWTTFCSLPVMMRRFEAGLPAMSSKKRSTGSWSSGMEAEVMMNWNRSIPTPSLAARRFRSSATSPPAAPLYMCASSSTSRIRSFGFRSSHFAVFSQIPFSVARMSMYCSME